MKPFPAFLIGIAVGGILVGIWFGTIGRSSNSVADLSKKGVTLAQSSGGRGSDDKSRSTFSVTDPRISLRELKEIGEKQALVDPVAAIHAAEGIAGYDLREAFLNSVFYTWGEKNGVEAVEWIRENRHGMARNDAFYFAGDGWAEADPEAAAKWFNENTEGAILDDVVWEAVESWGRKDPKAAFEWASQLDDYTKFSVMDGLAEGWAAIDPESAAEAAMEMVDQPYGYDFLNSVANQWGASDPEAAFAWADGILQEELREGVLMELGEQWAHRRPEEAAQWIGKIEDPGNKRFAQSGLAIGWSEHDPAAALNWALNLPAEIEAVQLNDMVGDIVFNWTVENPRGAAEWLGEFEAGERRDVALRSFSESVFDDDPYSAVVWAGEISNPAVRDPIVRELLDDWLSYEGENVISQVEQMKLPESVKAEFLNRVKSEP